MEAYICRTCGVQYAPSEGPPARCPICEDERQYVGWNGQQWTTMAELIAEGRQNHVYEEEPGLHAIDTRPQVSIGQRALLVQTPNGNVMWDCISFVDEPSLQRVRELGGLSAIAISHPHFYASMMTWSAAFGDCPVYIHAADRQWVQYDGPHVHLLGRRQHRRAGRDLAQPWWPLRRRDGAPPGRWGRVSGGRCSAATP